METEKLIAKFRMSDFNFSIEPNGPVSGKFLALGIFDFYAASLFIRQLAYKRNTNKNDLLNLFVENCGTCGTKHAVLKTLADENNKSEIKLVLGIYRMNSKNTPGIGDVLLKNQLDFIPEAHNYLRIDNQIWDCTFKKSSGENFENELLHEIEITPEQIADFKVNYHKEFLRQWLGENKSLSFTLPELWNIREACIQQLSEHKISA
jgi:hypothetical protein